jgi:hypothetical protein
VITAEEWQRWRQRWNLVYEAQFHFVRTFTPRFWADFCQRHGIPY